MLNVGRACSSKGQRALSDVQGLFAGV
jgi:hypothetical protein